MEINSYTASVRSSVHKKGDSPHENKTKHVAMS